LFYSAKDYFVSAYKALRSKHLNLDVPITIGILALYLQSTYTIISGDGPGFMDSFAGFIFFLLIGKWFQRKTYRSLSFERDHTSYFPVAVTRRNTDRIEEIVAIEQLQDEDIILIRNEEILPCDSELLSAEAHIDYSFVTGESDTIKKYKGDQIYAGGKLRDQRTEFKVLKKSDRSHLTRLWNEVKSTKEDQSTEFEYQNRLSYYFLIGLFIVAASAAIAWSFIDPSNILKVTVAILIVACPCALALSAPFTFGNIMRVLGRHGLYLKHTGIIENLNSITDIVFDKTGTLTGNEFRKTAFSGDNLSSEEWIMLYTLVNSSTHPNSRSIAQKLEKEGYDHPCFMNDYHELKGQGIQGKFGNIEVQVGNASYCRIDATQIQESASYIRIGEKTGKFTFSSELRQGIPEMLESLSGYRLHLLSGDNAKDVGLLQKYFLKDHMHFNQSPQNKYEYIKTLQENHRSVLMVGDGLNDAGALGTADVGIAVSEDVFRFAPSSDAIIEASRLSFLERFLNVSNFSRVVLKTCLIFSLSYNVIGLSFACSGQLTPLIAAILMPVSSITVVLISTFMSLSQGKRLRTKNMI
jgi:Cu+-exporting ATPase